MKTKPSELCKAVGLSSMKELSKLSLQSEQTLNNWFKHKYYLFRSTLIGCISIKAVNDLNAYEDDKDIQDWAEIEGKFEGE